MTEEVQIEVRVKPGGRGGGELEGGHMLAGIPVYDSAVLYLSVLGGTKKSPTLYE